MLNGEQVKARCFAIGLTFLLQLPVLYLPVGNSLFKTKPLSTGGLLLCIGVAVIVFHVVEGEKFIKMLWKKGRSSW